MKYQVVQTFLIVSLALCISSCVIPLDRIFSSYGYASTQLNQDDIVGIWIADQATLKDMQTRGNYDRTVLPKFIFHADGNFEMENMPDWWRDSFGKSYGGIETNSGTWKLAKSGCCWTISLNLKVPNLYTSVGLLKHRFNGKPEFLIERILGDPDSGNEMTFVKQ
jgi:hypothetical protein